MKQFFSILLAASMLLIGGCKDKVLDDDNQNGQVPKDPRTFSIAMHVPDAEASARVVASQKEDSKDIQFRWNVGDKIQLYFKTGTTITPAEKNLIAKEVSADGRLVMFDVTVPEGIEGEFVLYGVHGIHSKAEGENILLDATPLDYFHELSTIDIPIYFKTETLNVPNLKEHIAIPFQYFGSLILVGIENKSDSPVTLEKGVMNYEGNSGYHTASGNNAPVYNLVSGTTLLQTITFDPLTPPSGTAEVAANSNAVLAKWVMPNNDVPSALTFTAEINGESKITLTGKEASDEALAQGSMYLFEAIWNGTDLYFKDAPPAVLTPPVLHYIFNENTAPGSIMEIFGEYLNVVESVRFPGGLNAIPEEVNEEGTKLLVRVPEELNAHGPLTLLSIHGNVTTSFNINNTAGPGVFGNIDFDGTDEFGWTWYWGATRMAAGETSLFPGNRGDYLRIAFTDIHPDSPGWWENPPRVIALDNWKKEVVPIPDLGKPATDYVMKFEINTRVPITGEVEFFMEFRNFEEVSQRPFFVFYPSSLSPDGIFDTGNKWQTVRISLGEFGRETVGEILEQGENWLGAMGIIQIGIETHTDMIEEFDSAFDNFRIERVN